MMHQEICSSSVVGEATTDDLSREVYCFLGFPIDVIEMPSVMRRIEAAATSSSSLLLSPSRPGEFHPEPLTDPDVRLSPHPARATQRRLTPSSARVGFLRSPVDPTKAVSDPPPSLHGHYPASSLLWGGPRLTGPSVLSASRVNRLCLFPWHGQPGSQVPYESLGESHAS